MQDNNLKDTFTSKSFFLWSIIGPSSCGKTHELQRILLDKKYGIREHFKP